MNHRKFGYGFYFKCIQSTLEKDMNETLKEFDLTQAQEKVLRYVRKNRDRKISQRDIENFYHISNPTVSGILNRLEQKGYIRRIKSETDKRVRYVELTPKADELDQAIIKKVRLMEERIVKKLLPEEKEELYVLLEKVAKNLFEEEGKEHDQNVNGTNQRI